MKLQQVSDNCFAVLNEKNLVCDANSGLINLGGGVVECGTRRPLWVPYVEVDRVDRSTERARELGAIVLLQPREGPSGWRSIVSSPEAGEVALWEPKR